MFSVLVSSHGESASRVRPSCLRIQAQAGRVNAETRRFGATVSGIQSEVMRYATTCLGRLGNRDALFESDVAQKSRAREHSKRALQVASPNLAPRPPRPSPEPVFHSRRTQSGTASGCQRHTRTASHSAFKREASSYPTRRRLQGRVRPSPAMRTQKHAKTTSMSPGAFRPRRTLR